MVNSGMSLFETLKLHEQWLQKHNLVNHDTPITSIEQKRFPYVTCGDWDLKTCLPNQLAHHNMKMPNIFRSWVNIKKAYGQFYYRKASGMTSMLNDLGLGLQGQHHSAIDDSKNIARVCSRMIADGWNPQATTRRGTQLNSLTAKKAAYKLAPKDTKRRKTPAEVDETQCKTVYLIRHGQSEGQAARKQKRDQHDLDLTDCGLTSTDRNQAKQIPNLLGDVTIDLVVSSPLTRALNTAVLGFPNHDMMVHYEVRELGSRIPENTPRPMKKVMKTLQADIEDHASFGFDIDFTSLQPANWPNSPHSTIPKGERLHM
jgi:phosphohistidine phosphatase SixA